MPKRQARTLSGFELWSAVDNFLADYRATASPKTIRYYEDQISRALGQYLESRNIVFVEHITPQVMREYLLFESDRMYTIGNQRRRVSPQTVVHRYQSARRFFGWLVDNGHLADNPMREVRSPKAPPSQESGFSEDEVRNLLAEAGRAWSWLGQRDKAIVTVLLATGMRAAELLSMTLDCVEWDRAGGGRSGTNRRIKVVVKGGRERRIPFGDKAARAMKEYLRVRPQSRSTAFWLTFRGTPMTYGALNEMLKHLGDYAGVEHVHPHRFRHTAASEHYRHHNDMQAVKNFLGHSKIQTTEKYLRSLGFEYGLDLETPDAWLA